MRGGNFSCPKEENQWAYRRFGHERESNLLRNLTVVNSSLVDNFASDVFLNHRVPHFGKTTVIYSFF